MATHYTNSEWSLIKAAPHWVFAALSAADGRVSAITSRKESVAMSKILEDADVENALVEAAVDAGDDDHEMPKNITKEAAIAKLSAVNKLLGAKVGREDGEEFRDFLMDVGNGVADAAKEGMLARKTISDEEAEALQEIAVALEATAAYKQRRLNVEKKQARDEAAKARQAAAAAAAAKKEAADRAKKEAADRAASESAHAKRIAAARTRKAAAKKKAAEEAKKKAAAMAEAKKKVAAAKAAAKAETQKMAAASAAAAKEAAAAAAAAVEAAKPLAEHTVGAGDSLSAIAAKYYGSGVRANWMAIYEANKDTIGKNPGMIFPGMVLQIPKQG